MVEVGIEPRLEKIRGGFGVVVLWPAAVSLRLCFHFRPTDRRRLQLPACTQRGVQYAQGMSLGSSEITIFWHEWGRSESMHACMHAHSARPVPAILLVGGRRSASFSSACIAFLRRWSFPLSLAQSLEGPRLLSWAKAGTLW